MKILTFNQTDKSCWSERTPNILTVAGDLSGVSEEEQKQTTGWRIKSCSKEIPIKKVFLQLTCLDKITPGLTYLATYVE